MSQQTVHFEDGGQDFLEWDIDDSGKVTGCRPFQAGLWVGAQVIPGTINEGEHLAFKNRGVAGVLKYRIIAIEHKEAA